MEKKLMMVLQKYMVSPPPLNDSSLMFTDHWKSNILTKQNLAAINDNNNSTFFTVNKAECTYIELWADDLQVTSSVKVNITGAGM